MNNIHKELLSIGTQYLYDYIYDWKVVDSDIEDLYTNIQKVCKKVFSSEEELNEYVLKFQSRLHLQLKGRELHCNLLALSIVSIIIIRDDDGFKGFLQRLSIGGLTKRIHQKLRKHKKSEDEYRASLDLICDTVEKYKELESV